MRKLLTIFCVLLCPPLAAHAQLADIGGAIQIPRYPASINGTPTMGTALTIAAMGSDGAGYGIVFQAPHTGTITGCGTMTGTLTVADANTLIQVESVIATSTPAIPNGIIAANRSATVNVAASNTYYEGTLTSGYAATQGELIACTITRQPAGSLATAFNSFTDDANNSPGGVIAPYAVVNLTGAGWTALATASPVWAVNYGGTYYPITSAWPFSAAFATNTYNNTSTPDVYGNVWIPRFKCRVTGVWAWMDADGAAIAKFYDTDGVTVLAQSAITLNYRGQNGAALMFFPFDDSAGPTGITPTVGGTYRIGIEPSSATSLSLYSFTVPSAAAMGALGLGQNMYQTSAKDPSGTGSWTGDDTTKRIFMGIIIDQLDAGASGSGGIIGGGL